MIFSRDIYDFDKNTYLNFLAKCTIVSEDMMKHQKRKNSKVAHFQLFQKKGIKELKYSTFKLDSNTAEMDIDKI